MKSDNGQKHLDYARLVRVCQRDVEERRNAILAEAASSSSRAVSVLDDGTVVLPSCAERKIALVAHYDCVNGSYGYNDNGTGVVAILGMLDSLPANVEVVFTNGEERGSTGAKAYLASGAGGIAGCVNLDVCGCGERVYLDTMNFRCAGIVDAVCGDMPWNDGRVFMNHGIQSVCVSAGDGDDFRAGIAGILETIHNNRMDNRLDAINFGVLPKVRKTVCEIIGMMS